LKTALTTCAAVVAALVAAGSGSAAANSPVPVPGTPSCNGQLVAIANHSGGASGNPNASAGPGYFLHSETAGAIADYRAEYCGS
jgi:hypothetical protein